MHLHLYTLLYAVIRLQKLETITLPDGSRNSLVNLLWSAFQHPVRTISSAYKTVQVSIILLAYVVLQLYDILLVYDGMSAACVQSVGLNGSSESRLQVISCNNSTG